MCLNLMKKGFPVVGFDLNEASLRKLEEAGKSIGSDLVIAHPAYFGSCRRTHSIVPCRSCERCRCRRHHVAVVAACDRSLLRRQGTHTDGCQVSPLLSTLIRAMRLTRRRQGTLLLDCSTIDPVIAKEIAGRARSQQVDVFQLFRHI